MSLNPQLLELLEHFALDRTYVKGEGAWLRDEKGRRVLDLSAQYGALPFGHNPELVWTALERVRHAKVPALVQPSRPLLAEKLAERLLARAPLPASPRFAGGGGPGGGPVCTFSQSGSEGVEIAVKHARAATGRSLVVAAERGYHGKTIGASSLTWSTARATDASVAAPGFAHVPFDDALALERYLDENRGRVAAVILEPIQGEGGVFEPSPEYLPRVRELCTAHGVKLILDEVQTGLGRTGALFAADHWGVKADALVLSKALGGGLVPLAATLCAEGCWSEEVALSHGSTFANNNLTAAVGLAVLDALEADRGAMVERVNERGAQLRDGLHAIAKKYPGVFKAIRGRGLLLAVELEPVGPESSFFMRHIFEHGAENALVASWLLNEKGVRVIPCLTHGRALRVQPPLDLSAADAQIGLDAFEELARTIHHRDWSALVAPLLARGETGRRALDLRDLERPVRSATAVEVGEEPTRFAFLIHHTSPDDMIHTTPAFGRLGAGELERLYDWTAKRPDHSPLCFMPSIRGARGAVAQGWLLGVTHTPESMRARPRAEVSAEIGRAVRHAREKLGAHVVGLGAFTSIVTGNGAEVDDGRSALTTGSALTVAAAVDGVKLACDRLGVDPAGRRGLVLGLGVVGSAAAVVASDFLPRLVLVGNPARPERERVKAAALMDRIYARAILKLAPGRPEGAPLCTDGVASLLARLLPAFVSLGERGRTLVTRTGAVARGEDAGEGLAAEIAWACSAIGRTPPLALAERLADAVRGADVVISATSAAVPLIGPDDLRTGAIVCDVAKPADVSKTVRERRPDVLVFDGGLVRYPDPIAFGQNLGYEPGVNLACLTETVVLALEGVRAGRFGVGLASDLVAEVPRIRDAAQWHGFSVGELRAQGRILGEDDFARVRAATAGLRQGDRREHRGADQQQVAA